MTSLSPDPRGRSSSRRSRRVLCLVGVLALGALSLGGCATLPSSGPTSHQIVDAERSEVEALGYTIVDLDARSIDGLGTEQPGSLGVLARLASTGDVDAIGPGDELQISIFELGAALFAPGGQSGSMATSAASTSLPPVTVGRDGYVALPYIGRIRAAGTTSEELQNLVQQKLRVQSQNAQVLINVRDNITNTIVVSGDARKPGRQRLTLARAHVLDAIADAGGPTYATVDTVIRLTRKGQSHDQRLSDIRADSPDDIALLPGDRIELLRRPRTFTAFGATPKVSEVPFDTPLLTLAQAVARMGGPLEAQADPTGVFVFRYEAQSESAAPKPVIYRLNMMRPSSYFIAQRFAMRDKDVVYIANARSMQAVKLVQVINQLFSPVFTAKVLTQNN